MLLRGIQPQSPWWSWEPPCPAGWGPGGMKRRQPKCVTHDPQKHEEQLLISVFDILVNTTLKMKLNNISSSSRIFSYNLQVFIEGGNSLSSDTWFWHLKIFFKIHIFHKTHNEVYQVRFSSMQPPSPQLIELLREMSHLALPQAGFPGVRQR